MKTTQFVLHLGSVLALLTSAVAQQADAPPKNALGDTPARPQPGAAAAVAPVPAPVATTAPVSGGEKGLRFNFRGVPLEQVLSYLSDAAGFIIVLDTDVKGKVDVWSNQPLNKDEAVELLNTVLNKNKYAAIRNGRTLRIVSLEDARTKDIPVHQGSKPSEIEKSDEMVTQILPVRYANAMQLMQNLKPLLSTYAELSANESGNSLVLTATKSDVRRMAEIVTALDQSIANVSDIKVFQLKYADSKDLAAALKELFTPPATQNNNDRRNQFLNRMFGGGGGPGGPFGGGGPGGFPGGGGGGGTAAGANTAMVNNTRVIAVADERANALVVSAPEELMPEVVKLVDEMDIQVSDVTELRVFHLKNADPLDISDIMAELFPDDTRSGNNNNNNAGGFRFGGGGQGGFGGGFRGGGNAQNANQSQRSKKMGRVLAVADQRTSSIIISAASELMPQIGAMIEQLDLNPARRQRVMVYTLENADVQQAEQTVRGLFERSYTSGNRNTANQNSALSTRQQTQTQTGGTSGNSGFGGQGGGGVGGGGVGQFGR